MSELSDKSIRTLELPRVLALLSDQAVSAEARERALRVRPETETEEVLRLLDQTDAARTMIGLHGSPSFPEYDRWRRPWNGPTEAAP